MRKGSTQTLQSRAAISAKMKGKPKSPAQKEKMANARVAWWARKKKQEDMARRARAAVFEPILIEHGEPRSETITHKPQEFR